MKTTLKLAGWYGIGEREVEISIEAARGGLTVTAFLSGVSFADLGNSESRPISWDEYESGGDSFVRSVVATLAGRVVEQALPTKLPGEVYAK